MRGKVAVAELEPRLGAEPAQRFETAEGVATDAPAVFRVGKASERVHHRVEIGRDVQAMYLGIVSGVSDNEKAFGAYDASQSVEKAGGSDATGKRDYAFNARAFQRAAPCGSRPVMRKPECF